ncbi:sigma-54-dependent transcriptional regulator [Desulfobacula sp.]|uniref:sigma-54-dependent transcriptional regulator n=1 Tax=Desulfobacula sp. TaxID=2593537 RepID=UPI0039B88176
MKKSKGSILGKRVTVMVVDDEGIALKALTRILESEGYEVEAVSTGKKALKQINSRRFDLILTDLFIDEISGMDVLAAVKNRDPETAVIILTGHGSIDSAIEATKKDAFHYLQKPIRPDEVRHVVKRAVENLELIARIKELETRTSPEIESIIGNSPKIVAIKKLIRRIQDSESNVLITGESGTGKELVARAIHEFSPKKQGKFLAFNCASFTEDLLANELFGHEKDAFTGATKSRAGLFESANGGTVFLDEVGDMPMTMQVKLLRVIQEREVIRVGGTSPIPIDVRIIAATNQNLKDQYLKGYFRQDLFFRLNVIYIHVPNLNERAEDIPLLASHFLRFYAKRIGKKITGFTDEVIGLLSSYEYPGNIRELENIIEHAVSMTHGETITTENLPKDLMEYDLFLFHNQPNGFKTLEELEKEYIRWILDRVENKKTEASKILGIDRASLYRKLKRYEFDT